MSTAIATPPAKKLMTADEFWDYCQLPENANRWLELVRGEVVEMPRPTRKHGFICGNVARILGNYTYSIRSGYVASNDSGVILEEEPDTVVGPDVAYYQDAQKYDDLHPKWGEEVPLLAIEVLSPHDKPGRINQKIVDYLKNGVRVVWLIDPDERTVTLYRPADSLQILSERDVLTGGSELPGFECRVAEIFHLPGESAAAPAS